MVNVGDVIIVKRHFRGFDGAKFEKNAVFIVLDVVRDEPLLMKVVIDLSVREFSIFSVNFDHFFSLVKEQ